MKLRHAIPLAIALSAGLAPASAQVGPPPQCNDFIALRQETETRAKAIKAASERKATAKEACQLFTRYVAAESKMIKFMEDNQVWCGVPPDAISSVKAAHGKAQQMRQSVCNASAAGAAPRPKAPSLGEAIGTTSIPTQDNSRTGRGTLDSLTGNPLAR